MNKELLISNRTLGSLKGLLLARGEWLLPDRAGKKALALFHSAAERVPAYKAFLKSERVNHARVKTMADFSAVPLTDAKNYIARYPVEARCWDGNISSAQFIATSSGTTGEPKFWPRTVEQDLEAALVHEFLYREYFNIQKHSTLLLIGFPMGIYISGVATLLPSWLTALKKYQMTIMSVGNNKKEMLRGVQNLSHHYDQTVLIGHPFFIKDVIESGAREGIAWSKKHLGLMFCSEGFNEVWRSYIAEKAGIPASAMRIFNTYGSSEMLLMGYETPFSISVKRFAEQHPEFLEVLTGDPVAPQFFQYHPSLRYIESIKNELIFSSSSGIPLIRFNIHDRGKVFSAEEVKSAMMRAGGKPSGLSEPSRQLPLVCFSGRSDDTIKFYGVNIYPEHIKAGLNTKRLMRALTGKFVITKSLDEGMDQYWTINIELCQAIKPNATFAAEIRASVTETLRRINLEYLDMSAHIKKDVRPRIKLWPYQHTRYFKPGLKPHYIERHSNIK